MIIKNSKYIALAFSALGFVACNDDPLPTGTEIEEAAAVEVSAGSADFSKYVAIGNSLTAGFMDGALYIAAQENSFPNQLAQQFAKVGGGEFTQPLMADNIGGITLGGNRIQEPRLVFGGAGPVPLESIVGPVMPGTALGANDPTGPFNNMGVPGAKSFHLLANGYGNIANVPTGLANPYFARMTGSTPDASMIELAAGQAPTFFSLWIGNNDVLSFATSGGAGVDQKGNPDASTYGGNDITDPGLFAQVYAGLAQTLTANGAKGIVSNIADVTSIPFFTTVPHNPVPLDEATAGAVNQAYAAYNGGLQQALAALAGTGLLTQEEVDRRTISFSAGTNNAVVIIDEDLTDLGAINPAFAALPKLRQATADDLLVLPAASFIGTLADPNNPLSVNGVAVALADNWVLTPEEQALIADATAAFNATIASVASSNDLALLDSNTLLRQLTESGVPFGNFTLTGNLVTGGAFSLDGVHPGARGYGLTALEALRAIDSKYGSNFILAGAVPNAGDLPTNFSPTL
ncbi:SGNH/GDSL hydrolase family protein [Spongiivirga citrea]|uniref:G-D-S-L family lipolytic protein n=1 Tax=Spongiivirga citrea TaxID=1481457 RepID=A0A6M0CM40_9FLAO|nr:G-D-S-L family lipolytic protein [Spongiivirga citrea]NER17104.1 G-D-S-L family lipolytic protein [Spongiivirga citrea]